MRHLPAGQTIQPTELVDEAYMRICNRPGVGAGGRSHFFRAAARAMRDIIAERARARASLKRGGALRRVELDRDGVSFESPAEEILALDEALARLEAADAGAAEVVTLRFFAGLTSEAAAEV